MRPSRPSLVAGTAFVLAVFSLTVVFPEMRDTWAWTVVGAVYALTIGFGVGMRHLRSGLLSFRDTVGIAAVVVVVLVPLTVQMQAGSWGSHNPSFFQYWSVMLSTHFERFIPVAFMFPLGAATTRRHQLGTVTIIFLPSMYALVDGFVFHPERFDGVHLSPFRLVVSTGFWLLILVALGGLLFLVGRRFTYNDDIRQKPALRQESPKSG